MRQMASPMLSVPLVLDDCCTWRSHSCPTMTTRTNPTMKEAETPKPARQEGAPHLDLAAPCLASSFSPARSSCRSSRPLPALPPPSSPRTSPSERTERGKTWGQSTKARYTPARFAPNRPGIFALASSSRVVTKPTLL